MKKVLFLSLIFFLGLALAGFIPVKADSVVVNGSYTDTDTLSQADYDELQNTALLLKYLQNGGVVDVSNVSDGYSVSDLISDFGNFVKEVVPDLIDVINPFQSKFEWTPLGQSMLNNNMYKFMGMLPFYALQGPEEPDVNPDVNYMSYINTINGTGFYFKEYPIENYASYGTVNFGPNYNYSFCATSMQNSDGFTGDRPQLYVSDIVSINIIPSGNNYTIDQTISFIQPLGTRNNTNMFFYAPYKTVSGNKYYVLFDGSHSSNIRYQYTGTLEGCFQYLAYKFRNINIYVNGDLWAYVGNTTNYNLQIYNDTVSPVATNDYGYVHWVYDYEIFFRIDQIWDILQDILDNMGNGGNTIIKWPDIDDVIVDVDGQPAVAVKIYTPDNNIDEEYWSKYGPLVPVFIPLATPVINDNDILLIAETPMSALPDDLLDVFGYIFIGMLFVCFIHRLLE